MIVTGERARARGTAILAPLDDEQRAAVLAPPGPTLLQGGPGTGKSRVLAHRAAYVCAALGVPARRLLALVTSEGAAEALRARVERLLGLPIHGAWLGTPHAVCQRILRAHAGAVGRRTTFRIASAADARTLIRRVARELGVDQDRWPPARLQEAIARAKTERLVPDGAVGEVYRAYERALTEKNAVDPDDVLLMVLRLLEEHRTLRERYRRRFEHVLVDDYQDLGGPPRALLALFGAPAGNVLGVADDDVALSARAPGETSAARFLQDFPGTRVVALARNYRSTKRILYVAGRLIRHGPARAAPEPVPQRRRGQRVVAVAVADELEEASLVVRWIERLVRRGETTASRTAIMFRQAIQARPFEEALVRAGLPYRVVGGVRFHERREVRDVLCYLRLCVGGGDVGALARIANVPRRGIGPASVQTIARLQRAAPIGLAEAALRAAQLPRVTAQRAGALADLGRLLVDLEETAKRLSVAELIDFLVERSGYGAMLADLPAADEEMRREGIDELRGLARAFAGPAAQALPAFFERVARAGALPWASPPARDEESVPPPAGAGRAEGVQLLTLDAARGLEFETVFLTGVEEGVLPHARAVRGDEAAIDAERRLCYLGLTRARSRLVLTHALTRQLLGRPVGGAPSRFLREMGRRVRRFRIGVARVPAGATRPALEEPPALLVVRTGQRVVHPTYGEGVVLRADEPGPRASVTVDFTHVGEKKLILSLARLRPAG